MENRKDYLFYSGTKSQFHFDNKYVRNTISVNDTFGRERQTGEIILNGLPVELMDAIITDGKNAFDCKSDRLPGKTFYNAYEKYQHSDKLTPAMKEYLYTLKKVSLNDKGVFDIVKGYFEIVKDTPKYDVFRKLVSSTCTCKYRDYIIDWSGYIGHDSIGEFTLVMNNPIPMNVLDKMREAIRKHHEAARNEEKEMFDTKYGTKELEEISRSI